MTDSRLATWDAGSSGRVHDATMAVLADPGVDVHHEGARALLAAAGAAVDGVRVRFDAKLVENALATAPRRFPLTARGGLDPLIVEDGRVYFGTGGDCLYTRDLDTGERRRLLPPPAPAEGSARDTGSAALPSCAGRPSTRRRRGRRTRRGR